MSLLELHSKTGRKAKKRVGRGNSSGHGTYSCRGVKGQNARSGGRRRPGFEGGQTPFLRRMPKLKGFKSPNRIDYQIINIGDLNIFDDKANIDTESLYSKNLISQKNKPIKLLAGKGELEKEVNIVVHKASAKAIAAVEAKKGKIQLLTAKKRSKSQKGSKSKKSSD